MRPSRLAVGMGSLKTVPDLNGTIVINLTTADQAVLILENFGKHFLHCILVGIFEASSAGAVAI